MATGGVAHEKRRHKRDLVTVPVSYSPAPAPVSGRPSGAGAQAANGITLNISDSGICFYTQGRLEQGTALQISSRAFWEEPRTGTVMWCRKITEELYRVGLTFHD